MFPGVLPSISLASSPIALILLVSLSNATTEGSFNTTPFPLIYTKILAVPKSIPISDPIHPECPFLFSFYLSLSKFDLRLWRKSAVNHIFMHTVTLYTIHPIFQTFFYRLKHFN